MIHTWAGLWAVNNKLRLLSDSRLLQAPPSQDDLVGVGLGRDGVAEERGTRQSQVRPEQVDVVVACKYSMILLMCNFYKKMRIEYL